MNPGESKKQRLHFCALPHVKLGTELTCLCAYSARSEKFVKMLGEDYQVFMYAPEGPEIPNATLVPCLSDVRRQEIFGPDEVNRLPAWPTDEQSLEFNVNAIQALFERVEQRDFILLSGGRTHKPIADAFPNHIKLEPGVGYTGILYGTFCAFESWAHLNHVYAKQGFNDVRFFDRVIPNAFDPAEFPIVKSVHDANDYLLCVSRLVARKGIHLAGEIAQAAGLPLVVAGSGGRQVGNDIVAQEVTIKNARYVGPVGIVERNRLMAGARALLVPTLYTPAPFEGVSIEANFAGCPSITTNQGAFAETITVGVNGFRFNNMREAVEAVSQAAELHPEEVRMHAMAHYSLEAVAPKFKKWFDALETLWRKGFYEL